MPMGLVSFTVSVLALTQKRPGSGKAVRLWLHLRRLGICDACHVLTTCGGAGHLRWDSRSRDARTGLVPLRQEEAARRSGGSPRPSRTRTSSVRFSQGCAALALGYCHPVPTGRPPAGGRRSREGCTCALPARFARRKGRKDGAPILEAGWRGGRLAGYSERRALTGLTVAARREGR
jgi:hypothetical protein